MEPDWQIREVAAANQEHRGIKEAEPPSTRRGGSARLNLLGQIL
jgi:hypothetical protein